MDEWLKQKKNGLFFEQRTQMGSLLHSNLRTKSDLIVNVYRTSDEKVEI